MALAVIQRPEEELFAEENPTVYDTPYFTSRYNAANLPLVYKISNTKFPANSEDITKDIDAVNNNGGFAELVLDNALYTFFAKGFVEVTNTTSYNGVWKIREVVDADTIVINAPFVATETGNVQNYYNNYSTLVKVYAGLPENHPLNTDKPLTLITDNPITVVPNSDNEAVIDVSALVKSTLSLNNEYDLNDIELFTSFYIEYSEQYDTSDGVTVSTTVEAFQNDLIEGCDDGAADFITNGDFATDLTGWSLSGTGQDWAFDTGAAQTSISTVNRDSKRIIQSDLGLTDGVEYTLSFDVALSTSENVRFSVGLGFDTIYQAEINTSQTISFDTIFNGNSTGSFSSITFRAELLSSPVSTVEVRLDNVTLFNKVTVDNPCLAYIFAIHGALQPQATYGGNMGQYVQNFNSGVFANKWLTLFEKPVLFKGNYFDISTIIPQNVIQSAIQAGGYFLEVVEYDRNGIVIDNNQYPITQNVGGGIYRFRLDDKTFSDSTKEFTVQILRIPVNLFIDGDQGTFDTNITGITADAESTISRDIGLSFEGAASVFTNSFINPSDSFIFEVQTSGASEDFVMPLLGTGNYNFTVDWGDANIDSITAFNQPEVTHTYAVAGTYEVRINGLIEGWSFSSVTTSRLLIYDIKQWGTFQPTFQGAFSNCSNLNVTATDLIDLSKTSTLFIFFFGCSSLSFNSSVNNWDVSGITNMNSVFRGCSIFNQNLNNWDVSNVTTIEGMFMLAPNYNQPIGTWTTSSLLTTEDAFRGATAFDQDISNWNVTNLTEASNMFLGIGLSTVNYDALLVGWEAQAVQNNVIFSGGNSTYTGGSAADTARAALIADHTWTITDGGSI